MGFQRYHHALTDLVVPRRGSYFGASSGPIFLDQLHCSGDESSLLECDRFAVLGLHTCDQTQEAGVMCTGGLILKLLLDLLCIKYYIDCLVKSTE